jgi:hypothetical protein
MPPLEKIFIGAAAVVVVLGILSLITQQVYHWWRGPLQFEVRHFKLANVYKLHCITNKKWVVYNPEKNEITFTESLTKGSSFQSVKGAVQVIDIYNEQQQGGTPQTPNP